MRNSNNCTFKINYNLKNDKIVNFIDKLEKYHANLIVDEVEVKIVHLLKTMKEYKINANQIEALNQGNKFSNLFNILQAIDYKEVLHNLSFLVLTIKAKPLNTLKHVFPPFSQMKDLYSSFEVNKKACISVVDFLINIKERLALAVRAKIYYSLDLYNFSGKDDHKKVILQDYINKDCFREDDIYKSLPALASEEIFKMLSVIDVDIPIRWAYDLPSVNAIYAQTEQGELFCIKYGKNSCIELPPPLQFDLESGFMDEFDKTDWNEIDIRVHVPLELNERFEQWKLNNYEGELFKLPEIKSHITVPYMNNMLNTVYNLFSPIYSMLPPKKRALSESDSSQVKIQKIEHNSLSLSEPASNGISQQKDPQTINQQPIPIYIMCDPEDENEDMENVKKVQL